MATAWAIVNFSSTVITFPFERMMSAGPEAARSLGVVPTAFPAGAAASCGGLGAGPPQLTAARSVQIASARASLVFIMFS